MTAERSLDVITPENIDEALGIEVRRFAVDAVAAELRRRGTTRLTTTWHVGDGSPEPFYLGLGFRPTGEMSEDERVGELTLQV